MKRYFFLLPVMAMLFLAVGCGNPIKREPPNVFPGTDSYDKRTAKFKITPNQAHKIAYDQAKIDNQLHYISRRPTAIQKRWYIFSVPLPSGANLQGYHVHGDTGEVKFVNEKKVLPHNKR